MCIGSTKSTGSYDFLNPEVIIKSGLVAMGVAAGGIVTSIALKALGYSSAALMIPRTIAIVAGTIGVGMIGMGVVVVGIFASMMVSTFFRSHG